MKIVLAEERGGGQTSEKSFDQETIRVGRDAAECQIVFDNRQFPMVSRRHAELQRQNGRWLLHDLKSSYGTFVDGQQISAPHTVQIGSRLQFGANGPALRVVRFENAEPPSDFQNQPPVFSAPNRAPTAPGDYPNPIAPPNAAQQNQLAANQIVQLEFVDAPPPAAPYKVAKDSVWLGRDPNGDIVFDANAVMVSRKHAEIRRQNGIYVVYDGGSFNGTLVNEQRISAPTPLYHDDRIQLGMGGPVLRFNAPLSLAPKGASLANQRSVAAGQLVDLDGGGSIVSGSTMVFNVGSASQKISKDDQAQPQLLMSLAFGGKKELIVGRDDRSDIKIDGLQISNRHARLVQTNSGIVIEDLNSTNGVYVNGNRVTRHHVAPDETAQIGSFRIKIDRAGNILIFDTRSTLR